MHIKLNPLLTRITWLLLSGFFLVPLHAELRVGDDRLTVFETLGVPKGRIEMGTIERLFYDRGEVRLREGLVSEIDLISETAARTHREQQAREAETRRERGEALKAERLADPDFRARPAARRYAFWRDFRREFPDVDVFAQYTDAKADAEQDAERQRTAARIANVERRLADAEFRAQRAQTTAQTTAQTRNTPTRIQFVSPNPIIYHTRQHTHGPYRKYIHHRPHVQSPPPRTLPGTNIRIQGSSQAYQTQAFHSIGSNTTAQPISGFSFQRSTP